MTTRCKPPDCPILLVEDNPDDIMLTKRAFTKCQIQNKLYVTHDGEEAIQFLRKKGKYKDAPTPGIVLLDLKMPKLDGFEVLENIKSDDKLKTIPIVVLTVSARDKDIERSYKLGCNTFITKPASFKDFIETMMQIKRYWLIISKIPLAQYGE
ncbi:MAG: response regulator [Candidatus Bathyarchaeum sp.]|nr:MAG: response regulator [Candidatus Bathyarchaeum sp.]